jgi:peptidoglycan-associated lipoprotein
MVADLTIFFGSEKYDLTADHVRKLEAILQKIDNPREIWVNIEGHADHTGWHTVDNDFLSQQRADSVAVFMQENGIPDNQIETKGYGASLPMDDRDEPSAWAMNRRVVIRIFKGKPS